MLYVKKLISSLKNAKKANYGMLNIWYNRAKQNWQTIVYLQITALTLKEFGWTWWYIPCAALFVLWTLFHNTVGLEQEIDYLTSKNTRFMEMYDKILSK